MRNASSPGMKKYLHWAGSTLAVIGILFVVIRLRGYSGQINFKEFDPWIWWAIGSCALVYGISNVMLALAWWNLLGQFGTFTSRRWVIRAYGITQLAKYVPGNIFHIAGRQAVGMAAGLPGWSLAKASIWELALIASAGSLFGSLALPLMLPSLPLEVGAVVFATSLIVVAVALRTYLGQAAVWAFGWYVGFLSISGMLFVCLVGATSPVGVAFSTNWILLCGAYVVAWLAGLLTPGAPAGVGVREIVLIFLLNGLIGESELLLAVILGRVVTVVGDLLFFVIASLQRKSRPVEVR